MWVVNWEAEGKNHDLVLDYEVPHYVLFSTILLLILSRAKTLLKLCSQTTSTFLSSDKGPGSTPKQKQMESQSSVFSSSGFQITHEKTQ